MNRWAPFAVAAGIILVGTAASAGAASAGAAPPPPPVGTLPAEFQGLEVEQARMAELGDQVEALGLMPGFTEFLFATADIESSFKPEVQNGTKMNSARGWFQNLPKSAMNWRNGLEDLQSQPNLLKNRAWAVALAADYAKRLYRWGDEGQGITMYDLRRGWAQPKLMRKKYRSQYLTKKQNFIDAIERTGGDPSAIDKPIPLGDYPGVQAILDHLGAPPP